MQARLTFAITLLALVAVTSADNLPQDVQQGFYPGRSGNVVIRPQSHAGSDAATVLLDRAEQSVFQKTAESSMSFSHVADVVARALGVLPPNPSYSPAVVSNNLFSRSKAHAIYTIPSVGRDATHKYGMKSVEHLSTINPSFSLTDEAYPSTPLSLLATVATGRHPQEHGIVGASFPADGKTAYKSASSWSARANLADVLAQTFDGQSLLVSASASSQLANAFCVHPSLRAQHPEWTNQFCMSMNNNNFKNAESNNFLNMNLLETLSSASTVQRVFGPSAAFADNKLTVASPDAKAVSFYLNTPEHANFISEMLFADNVISKLENHPLTRDAHPDLFAFSFSSIAPLLEKYGRHSEQFQAALLSLDANIIQTHSRIHQLYNQGATGQIVLLGSHPSLRSAHDSRSVIAQVARLLPGQNTQSFPALHVEATPSSLVDICDVLSLNLQTSGYSVYCPEAAHVRSLSFTELSMSLSAGAVANSTTVGTVVHYQIVLWISLVLFFVIVYVVYSTAYMSFKKDSLLFGSFNPHWEESRKRK
jgi:hypothetical protein